VIDGFEVSGIEIDKVLAPAGLLSKKDRVSVIEAAVDVATLPGMFSASHSQAHDEVKAVTEAATAMSAPLSGKQAHLHDTQWKNSWKNSLGRIKKRRQTWLPSMRLPKTRPFLLLNNKTVVFECSCVRGTLIITT
jgi:hypothetical protein